MFGLCFVLSGCQAGYYAHLLRGQYDLLSRRVPIEELLTAPDTSPALRQHLMAALEARKFATQELHLPGNGSYTAYADLGRSYAVWNVFAAPEFSLKPVEWCFGLVGCLAYRGYYDEAMARAEASALAAQGYDAHVFGVQAYSTLGWFDDPVLNTMLYGSEDQLAGTIFHELAHQQLFVKGDTAFNESFASFVEQQGLREYLRESPERARQALQREQRQTQFSALMLEARSRLEALYAQSLSPDEMRPRKRQEFARLREEYAVLRSQWGGAVDYNGWMSGSLNNAWLLPFGLYSEWVPAFAELFGQAGGDWPAFYLAAESLADLQDDARVEALKALRLRSPPSR